MKQNTWFGVLLVALTSCTAQHQDKDALKTTYVHQYGVEVADSGDWEKRGANGQTVQQLKNGATLTKSWHDGELHGTCTLTFPHTSTVFRETFYEKGARVWMMTNYPSGAPKRQDTYLPEGGLVVATWYEDGTPRAREEYCYDDILTGQYFTTEQELESEIKGSIGQRVNRDGHGQLVSKETIKDGQLALEVSFYPNGMPKKETPYAQGKIDGMVRTYYPGGEPQTVEEWQEGFPNGITTIFQNGEKIALVPYIDGVKEGKEERFRPGTQEVVEEIAWKNNKRHGPTFVYVDGQKVTDWYHSGEKVSRIIFIELEATAP
jgi:antitoxin component YwqK of YwqJK toxin-antitoxin module